MWEVFEVRRASEAPRGVSPGLEKGWLTFVSAEIKRRLAPFPDGWTELSELELEALCRAAREAPVSRVTPAGGIPVQRRSGPESLQDAVRQHARSARTRGVPVIAALLELKNLVASRREAGALASADGVDVTQIRRWFVDAYYFDERREDAKSAG